MLLSYVAVFDLELHQMDVVTAFLYGDTDKDVYMEKTDGFVNPEHPRHVCKLRKALYGLKQSSRLWYAKIDYFLIRALKFGASAAEAQVTLIYTYITNQNRY